MKNVLINVLFLLVLSLLAIQGGYAQKTCNGKILDYDTEEPVSFVSVWIKNTNQGCLSNIDGTFSIELGEKTDTLMVSAVGYKEQAFGYADIPSDELKIFLIPTAIMLEPAVIVPGKNKAIPIVKKAIKNRRDNTPHHVQNIQFLEYNKLSINLSNFDSTIFQSKFIKKHPEILIKANDYDTTWSIPLYFSERLTFQKRTDKTYPEIEEIAENQYGSAFINSDITTKYIESLNQDLTFYGNVRFLSKDFISPISLQAFVYYDFYLRDSIKHNDTTYYQIKFKPKNKQDLAFYGFMVIENNSGALTDIQATLQSSANLNYVNNIHIHEQLQQHPSTGEWFFKTQKLDIEFSAQLSKDTTTKTFFNMPLRAMKNTNYVLDTETIHKTLHEHFVRKEVQTKQHKMMADTSILAEYRPDTLTRLDVKTQDAIKLSNEIPAIQTTNKLLDMFLYGYLPLGYVELGPYLYFVQHNEIEGYRLNVAARTSPQLHENMMIGGYLGYGLKDKEFKFGAKFAYRMPSSLLGVLHASYDQNIYRIGDYQQNLDYIRENVLVQSDDNVLSALTSRHPNKAVYFVKKAHVAYEQQLNPNVIVKPAIEVSKHHTSPFYEFSQDNQLVHDFSVAEASCNLRLSFDEKISDNHFRRIYIDSRHPIIHMNVAYGTYKIASDVHDYTAVRLVAKQNFLFLFGRLSYVVESGISFNPLPYPLMEFQRGNETGSSGEYYFNLMKYLEFGSDRFVNLYAEYGLNGFIFNKIPLIKRLQLRELFTFKAAWGGMHYNHDDVLALPSITQAPTIPYLEAGVGITNLLKIIRVEYIWRINHRNAENILKQGMFFRFQLEF
ncbi:MAG: DUF5686 family protein [Bacteroidales bacterium]